MFNKVFECINPSSPTVQENSVIMVSKNEDEKSSDVRNNESTVKRIWRHWILGPIIFISVCGMSTQRFTTNQYLYRRIQEEMLPNKSFVGGTSYCANNINSSDAKMLEMAQKTTADYQLVFSILNSVPAIFANLVLGSFTDKYGRKILLTLTISGKAISSLIFVIGSIVKMDLKLFGIAYFIDGLSGQQFSVLLAGFAIISDVTTHKGRGIAVVLIEVCIGFGASTASLITGYFIQSYGFVVPYTISVVCLFVALLTAISIIPESFPKEKRSSTKTKCDYIRQSFEFYYASWNRGKRWKYVIVIAVFSNYIMAFLGRESIETLYQLNVPFCWTPSKIGLYGALRRFSMQCAAFIIINVIKRFVDDDMIAIFGAVSFGAGCVLEGLAVNDTMLYLVAVVGSACTLPLAMLRSIISRMTSPQRQGAVAASLSVAETAFHLFSGILANAIYGATVATYRGATFFVLAAISVFCIILLVIFKIGSRNSRNKLSGMEYKNSIQVISFSQKTKI